MFSKIINKIRAWRLSSKLEHYAEILEDIDGANCKPEEYPVKLKEFWRLFDMSLLDGLAIRDVMGHVGQLRHRTFAELHRLLLDANDAIANEQDSRIDYVLRTGLQHQKEVDLDNYFFDPVHGHLDIRECLEQLRQLLQAHCGILDNIEGTYGQRKMLHAYFDIYTLSDMIIDVLHDKGEIVFQ
ncbi:hypothetical protein MZD04_gp232 [Pseudomonas phage Psa21]|uniref:Uncharacterized protein n=1 Tax=Pseudomonas phage Psa21 TaxID=2530023 RepID=A0A481W4Z3_9CAUD|nr:hypothetical protein MZD04_gp232 [Pseudomonas phage Psa21]QBJ02758.1 hypothetical protein PSA21_232 [Pseudomonas phage Psa21]